MIINENAKAYAEIDFIMKNMIPKEYVNKIPDKLREFFYKNKDANYRVKIDVKKSLLNQNLLESTKTILGMLKLYYWCSDKKEKSELTEIMKNNNKK